MATHHVLDRPGCAMAWRELAGERTPVVLLHGAGLDHAMWWPQAERLTAAGHRVVVPDLRGHGDSRPVTAPLSAGRWVDDIAALLDVVGEPAVVVGLSLGGNIVQALIERRPVNLLAAGVVDSTWNRGPLGRIELWSLGLATPALRLVPASRLPRMMAKDSAERPEVRDELEATFGRITKDEFIDIWRATTEFVAPGRVEPPAVPLLMMRGQKDGTGNIATAMDAWAAELGQPLQVIPGAGHVSVLDEPEATDRVLRVFLDRVIG